jgi:hypothetical protein
MAWHPWWRKQLDIVSALGIIGFIGAGFSTMIPNEEYIGAIACWIIAGIIIIARARSAPTFTARTLCVIAGIILPTILIFWTNQKRDDKQWSFIFGRSENSFDLELIWVSAPIPNRTSSSGFALAYPATPSWA